MWLQTLEYRIDLEYRKYHPHLRDTFLETLLRNKDIYICGLVFRRNKVKRQEIL